MSSSKIGQTQNRRLLEVEQYRSTGQKENLSLLLTYLIQLIMASRKLGIFKPYIHMRFNTFANVCMVSAIFYVMPRHKVKD